MPHKGAKPPHTPAALKSLSNFAGAKSRDRAGRLMPTPNPCVAAVPPGLAKPPTLTPPSSRNTPLFRDNPQKKLTFVPKNPCYPG